MPVLEKALDTGAEVSVILEKYIEKEINVGNYVCKAILGTEVGAQQ